MCKVKYVHIVKIIMFNLVIPRLLCANISQYIRFNVENFIKSTMS